MRKKILLLGSGELGKELVIAMQRLGQYVIAVDNYENAPAMQVSHEYEVINMLDGNELDRIVEKHNPDFIVPEVESIRTERFYNYEQQGYTVIPSAKAANFTMNRKSIRDLAAVDLGIKGIRVDCVQPPTIHAEEDFDTLFDRLTKTWDTCINYAADKGIYVTWEFEPGFAFNKPSLVLKVLDKLQHDNFGLMYDTCHGQMLGVIGVRQEGEKEIVELLATDATYESIC